MKSFTKITETVYEPVWIHMNFTSFTEEYEKIRKRMGGTLLSCIKCGHKFERGEMICVGCFRNIGNNTLCEKCAKELNE